MIAVALLVVVALVAPYFLDVDHSRALISTTVKKQTGRELTIGKIRAKFLPTVGFVVSDAHLGNPPGFPQG
ncbi:MAG TPA: AsmA family protein, partial [Candidatus Limnocylindria bacterium]|nr:AsmA family protein [Candidatus Limnocylindria bacterium]